MKHFLDYASQKYYEGNPIISDEEFDRLAEQYNYERVGYSIRDGVPHTFPMYSLKKCYVGEDPIKLPGTLITTPKLDGAAVSLLYVEGEFRLALTRGDGKRGQDITNKMLFLIPTYIYTDVPLVQITGEVCAKKNIPNARNYASGALNLKDNTEFGKRELTFIAYGVQVDSDKSGFDETYRNDMEILEIQGFKTVCHAWDEFPKDGEVIRVNENNIFDQLGYTSSHPKGAYARKERQEGVITTLLDVTWQVGRSGVVAPVAILSPVRVGDALVSRATLHNMKYIESLGLEIGCQVEVIRSSEIIPRVVRRV